MKKASFLIFSILGLFLIAVLPSDAQSAPPFGYLQHGDFFCNRDPNFEKPDSVGAWPVLIKFCQPQLTGCEAGGDKFCTAGTRNACCPSNNTCGKGTVAGAEVAICVPPLSCNSRSSNYAGTTKEGKNVCCRNDQEPGPAGGKNAPYCQPKAESSCAAGQRFVQGTDGEDDRPGKGKYLKEKRCCASGTVPAHHSNGMPFCARLPLALLSPNGGEQIPKSGPPYLVKWSTNGVPSTQSINLKLFNSQNRAVYEDKVPNTGTTGFKFAESTFPFGQYKFELSATVDGETVIDRSDGFFTLAAPRDTDQPLILLQAPKVGVTTTNRDTRVTVRVDDPSGVRLASIGVKSPGANDPLLRTCTNQYRAGLMYCSLAVSANRWVNGTTLVITAVDDSSDHNVALEIYVIRTGQLEWQPQNKDQGNQKAAPPAPVCRPFQTDLRFGMRGNEVTALQTALNRAGFPITQSENGIFGEHTASAVSSFQLAHKNEILTAHGLAYPTGYFGPATRQKLNQLWGCGG